MDAGEVADRWPAAWADLDRCRGPVGFHASEAAGLYPAVFGRDSLWVVLLLLEATRFTEGDGHRERIRDSAEWALAPLVERQADRWDDRVEAQPGKILHAFWPTPPEDPRTAGLPLVDGVTYCGFDQTMLFVIAAVRFLRIFPDSPRRGSLEAAAARGVRWLVDVAFDERTGLCAYARRNRANPVHQVWKDSFDSITHGGFDVPPEPVAWIEVQAYAHLALREAATLPEVTAGGPDVRRQAADLRDAADRALWWEAEDCYAVGLDAGGSQVPMVTSNAGHALWGGLPDQRRAAVLAERLGRPDLLTSYGIRTLSGRDRFFEATSYHRGSVWPFDNAVIAAGLVEYGFHDDAARLASRVLDALALFGSPVELYCVESARALVHPPLPDAGELLLSRRSPPQNAVQAFSAAAQIFFLALVAAHGGIPLPGG